MELLAGFWLIFLATMFAYTCFLSIYANCIGIHFIRPMIERILQKKHHLLHIPAFGFLYYNFREYFTSTKLIQRVEISAPPKVKERIPLLPNEKLLQNTVAFFFGAK